MKTKNAHKTQPPQETLMPAKYLWGCFVIPLVTTLLFDQHILEQSVGMCARTVFASAIPSLTIGSGIYLVYRYFARMSVTRIISTTASWIIRITVVVTNAIICGYITFPLVTVIDPSTMNHRPIFLVRCIAISAIYVLPILIFQELRQHAREIELNVHQQKQKLIEAQLQALQARTDPHFLFNSINTVACLIPEDPALAEKTLERLADLFRYALDASRTKWVPMAKELDMVREYFAVQAVRFGERLRWDIIEHTDTQVLVPPFTLQPLVENAVIHGIGQRPAGGKICVEVYIEDNDVVCRVIDDGPGHSDKSGSGTAINDLRSRLHLLFRRDDVLITKQLPEGGFQATIRIPKSHTNANTSITDEKQRS